MRFDIRFCYLHIGMVLVVLTASAQAGFEPWDPLVADSWIYFGDPQTRMVMHTANGTDFEVGFDQRRSDDAARGFNALRFSYGGENTGRLVSTSLADSFDIQNTGNTRTFSDLLLLAAIDAPEVHPDFAMSIGAQGAPSYQLDPATDLGYYDHPAYDTGRPSGYYSATSPSREGISYSFDRGLVTVVALPDIELGPGTSVTVDYTFEHLPGTVVFSVYGVDKNIGWIFHTNRVLIDDNRPDRPVSTFEVVPEPGTLLLGTIAAVLLGRRRLMLQR